MKFGLYIFLFVSMLFFALTPLIAQEDVETTPEPQLLDTIRAHFESSDLSPLLGVPVELNIIVDMPPEAELIEFPEFPDDWGDFMVREVDELVVESTADGRVLYTQNLTVILWDVGDFDTPDTFVGYQLIGEEDAYYVPVNPVSFFVPSMLNPDMNQNELRPLNPQISLFYVPLWVIIGCMLIIGVCAWIGRLWYRRIQANKPIDTLIPIDPVIIARSELAKIDPQVNLPNEAFDLIDQVLRRYLHDRLSIEMADILRDDSRQILLSKLDPTLIQELDQLVIFLQDARFSPIQSSPKSIERLLSRCTEWINAVEQVRLVGVE